MSLMERARQRLAQWMAANPKITQVEVGRAVGHAQGWVSEFTRGLQGANVDELDAMAQAFNHTLNELLDLRPDPKEQQLLDAYRALPASKRPTAISAIEAMLPEPKPKRQSSGKR